MVVGTQTGLAGTPCSGPEAELIEWREYTLAFRGNRTLLLDYLRDALAPALRRKGATQFQLYTEYADPNPGKLHIMIAYSTAQAYYTAQDLSDDGEFQVAREPYVNLGGENPIFSRYTSYLMRAFSGMPQSVSPDDASRLFELRIYESANEDALRRKIRMFNDHELTIFDETGLDPVFFGDLIAGPYRPALVYLLQFDDMADRDASWGKFGPHPEWQRIKELPEFAGTVSNIRRTFLLPA
jgi:hypothetical protein